MPIYDNNGTTNYEIGVLYDNDGTTNYQIGKIYDNDGTTNCLIYSSNVTLTNLLNEKIDVSGYWADHGTWTSIHEGDALPTVPGHKYYVNVSLFIYAAPCSHGYNNRYGRARAIFNGTVLATTLSDQWSSGHAIITATSNSTKPQLEIYREQADSGNGHAYYSMVVDVTELEAATGTTYTADSFWSFIGGGVFYGSKEFNV